MRKELKIYYRIKCSMKDCRTLANYNADIGCKTGQIYNHHITFYLPRIINAIGIKQILYGKYDWDRAFSHTISHEYIHKLAYAFGGISGTVGIDKIVSKGNLPKNDEKLIGDGL